MLEAEANSKVCPYMSIPIHEPATQYANGFTTNHETYCVGSRCMAWEPTQNTNNLEGYCKLMEERI